MDRQIFRINDGQIDMMDGWMTRKIDGEIDMMDKQIDRYDGWMARQIELIQIDQYDG